MHAPFLIALALAACATGQQVITIPAGAIGRDGTGLLAGAGFEQPLREQFLFGATHLTGLVNRDLLALRMRRDGTPVEQKAGQLDLTLTVSASNLLDVRSPSPVFADNHRVPATTVFQGLVSLPHSLPLAHRHAATWSTPDAVTVPFAAPFRYLGGALCVQLDGVPRATLSSPWWPVDGERDLGTGVVTTIGQGCGPVAAIASRSAGVEARMLRVGSTPRFTALGQPGNPAFLFLSSQVLSPGVDLSFLGAPGCFVYVVPDTSIAAMVGRQIPGTIAGGASIEVTLPTLSGLLGATLHTQWAVLAGTRLTTTNALTLQLGADASSLDGAVVISKPASASMLPLAGTVDTATMAVVQFDYR